MLSDLLQEKSNLLTVANAIVSSLNEQNLHCRSLNELIMNCGYQILYFTWGLRGGVLPLKYTPDVLMPSILHIHQPCCCYCC